MPAERIGRAKPPLERTALGERAEAVDSRQLERLAGRVAHRIALARAKDDLRSGPCRDDFAIGREIDRGSAASIDGDLRDRGRSGAVHDLRDEAQPSGSAGAQRPLRTVFARGAVLGDRGFTAFRQQAQCRVLQRRAVLLGGEHDDGDALDKVGAHTILQHDRV